MKKGLILFLILVTLAGAGFYLKDELADLYLRFVQKIPAIEKASLDLVNQIEKEVNAPPPLRLPGEAPLGNLTKAGVIKWTNTQRTNFGLSALLEDSKLNAAALAKAQDILKKQYFAHVSPTSVGPAELAKSAGYDYLAIGENLAMGNFKDDQSLVQSWMDSPGHRANILNSRYSQIGVAVVKGTLEGRTTWVAVQEFGLPASACPSPSQILNVQIESNLKQIDSLASQIQSKRLEIESLKKRDPAFVEAVNQYNALVEQYNVLVGSTKNLITSYNRQVEEFNQCVQQ